MKAYIIVKLENNKKCIIIDTLKYQSKEYFLITEVSEDEINISDDYKVCLYDSNKNCFVKIENAEELNSITAEFENKINNKSILEESICLEEFIKLKIIDINNYDYTFELEDGSKIIRNIEFYLDNKPKMNDYIYISEDVIKENRILQYGYIKDLKSINNKEIIKVVSSNNEYYYQRYYG